MSQVWFANDVGAAETLCRLHVWWAELVCLGAMYRYFVNPSKTWLVVKPEHYNAAVGLFVRYGICIMREGRPYLSAPLGTSAFAE